MVFLGKWEQLFIDCVDCVLYIIISIMISTWLSVVFLACLKYLNS